MISSLFMSELSRIHILIKVRITHKILGRLKAMGRSGAKKSRTLSSSVALPFEIVVHMTNSAALIPSSVI